MLKKNMKTPCRRSLARIQTQDLITAGKACNQLLYRIFILILLTEKMHIKESHETYSFYFTGTLCFMLDYWTKSQ